MSTTGVYGDAGGATVDETQPGPHRRTTARAAGSRPNGRPRTWCERTARAHVVLRVPGIYGPDRLPLERLGRGEPTLRPEDSGPGNRIHVDDLVATCVAAVEQPVSGVFNVGDGDHSSTTEFLLKTAELAGLTPPRLVSLAEARDQVSQGMLEFLVESRRVDTTRMRVELGVEPRYASVESGIAASLEEMRAQRP